MALKNLTPFVKEYFGYLHQRILWYNVGLSGAWVVIERYIIGHKHLRCLKKQMNIEKTSICVDFLHPVRCQDCSTDFVGP